MGSNLNWKPENMSKELQERIATGIVKDKQDKRKRLSFRIEIDETPPSQNETDCWHWAKKAKEKKRWEQMIINYGYIWKGNGNTYAKKVKITFMFPDMRRRDKDNYIAWKAIMDSLVKADIIKDDSVKDIEVTYDLLIGTGERKTVIEVEK